MTKIVVAIFLIITIPVAGWSQLYMTRTGFVGFYSRTSLEDIRAENNQAYAIIDAGKKNIAFSLLMKGFVFPKALMQEHFNENYVESDKYPKATFSGTFSGDPILTKDGVYQVKIKGNLSLHNVTKPVETPATMEVKNGRILGTAEFKVKPEDFNISIPSIVRDKIEKEMKINVKIDCATK
jgi:hypothetical protein